MKYEMWRTIVDGEGLLEDIKKRKQFILPYDILTELLSMSVRDRMKEFEAFCNVHFGESEYVDLITSAFNSFNVKKAVWYRDMVYMPFEYTQIPVPADYDLVLTKEYGNYHEIIMGGSTHEGIIFDPDVPYTTYMESHSGK